MLKVDTHKKKIYQKKNSYVSSYSGLPELSFEKRTIKMTILIFSARRGALFPRPSLYCAVVEKTIACERYHFSVSYKSNS